MSSRLPEDIYWRLPGLSAQELHQEDLGVLLTDKFRLEQVTLDRVMVNTLTVEAGLVNMKSATDNQYQNLALFYQSST